MSGHSKWATIKRKKGAADAARGKLFNRLIREITVAAKMGGSDPDANPRLRSAISTAKSNNMPHKNIDSAVKKGAGELEGVSYEEIVFEGYGPGGVAIMVETLTDNRNRTVAEVRHAFSKHGGNLGSANSVAYMFTPKGIITVSSDAAAEDKLMEIALEAGAEDMKSEDGEFEISCEPEQFEGVKKSLVDNNITISSSEVTKIPDTAAALDADTAQKVLKLLDYLDELDDTQKVYSNADFSSEDISRFNA